MVPNIRPELQALYDGRATVYGFVYEDTGHGAKKLSSEPTAIYEDIPCRLSYETIEPNNQDRHGDIVQEIVLFCDPSYYIEPGARIRVTQAGSEHTYEAAGLRAMYISHQEVKLRAFRKRA